MADTTPPTSISGWLEQVNKDPAISPEYKNGREDQLKLSGKFFSTGLLLDSTENLYLRTIWHTYPFVECLEDMMMDNPEKGHIGYVSSENNKKAKFIFRTKGASWEPYFRELKLRAADKENLIPNLRPMESGFFSFALHHQLLVLHGTSDEPPTIEDLERGSSIVKFGLEAAAIPTPSPTDDPAKDECFAFRALLELLVSITLGFWGDLGTFDWLPDHLPFQLMEDITATDIDTQEVKLWTRELMEARVDGFLCRRTGPFLMGFNKDPAAILEVKPFTRSNAGIAIRRHEGAQMACLISKCGDLNTGLLQTSANGSKR